MLLLTSILACTHSHPATQAPTDTPILRGDHLPLAGLRDVACNAETCVALTASGLRALPGGGPLPSPAEIDGYDTLRTAPGGWELEGPCPGGRCVASLADGATSLGEPKPAAAGPTFEQDAPSLDAAATAFSSAWKSAAEHGWRSPFTRLVVAPGGGRVTWLRGVDGAGQLLRAGGGSRAVRVAANTSPVSFPGWIALHPTGQEAYLVVWPSPWVRAFDPATLESRWTLPLEGAAQGLFVDADGRWLVVAVGEPATDRLVDWALPLPDTQDPARDEVVRMQERPDMRTVLVIDLAAHEVAAEARGKFRRFLHAGKRILLATDQEVVTFQPGEPPR